MEIPEYQDFKEVIKFHRNSVLPKLPNTRKAEAMENLLTNLHNWSKSIQSCSEETIHLIQIVGIDPRRTHKAVFHLVESIEEWFQQELEFTDLTPLTETRTTELIITQRLITYLQEILAVTKNLNTSEIQQQKEKEKIEAVTTFSSESIKAANTLLEQIGVEIQ